MKFLVVLVLASAALAAPLPPAGPAYASASDNYPTYAVRTVDAKPDCDNATTVSAEGLLDDLTRPLLGIAGPLLKPLLGPLLPAGLLKSLVGLPILGDILAGLLGGGANAASVESYDFNNGTETVLDRDEIAAAGKVLSLAAKELASAFSSISVADEETTMLETVTSTVTDAPTSTADAADVDPTETKSWSMTESSSAVEPTDVDFSFSAHIGEGMKGARML